MTTVTERADGRPWTNKELYGIEDEPLTVKDVLGMFALFLDQVQDIGAREGLPGWEPVTEAAKDKLIADLARDLVGRLRP